MQEFLFTQFFLEIYLKLISTLYYIMENNNNNNKNEIESNINIPLDIEPEIKKKNDTISKRRQKTLL